MIVFEPITGKINPTDILSKHWSHSIAHPVLKPLLCHSGNVMDLIEWYSASWMGGEPQVSHSPALEWRQWKIGTLSPRWPRHPPEDRHDRDYFAQNKAEVWQQEHQKIFRLHWLANTSFQSANSEHSANLCADGHGVPHWIPFTMQEQGVHPSTHTQEISDMEMHSRMKDEGLQKVQATCSPSSFCTAQDSRRHAWSI